MTRKPAISLAAVPGRRPLTLEIAQDIEKRGFSGIYCPSMNDCMALCQALGHVTNEIEFGTSIHPIYFRHPRDLAKTASFIHEVSQGRFRLGIGVSHGPMLDRYKLSSGKPLSDMRQYVEDLRAAEKESGPLPRITLATLRSKMLDLALEIADGAVWANGSLSHMPTQLPAVQKANKPDFFVGDMIPTTIDDDKQAAANVNRKTLTGYVSLPNYRNYWRAAGYVEEMDAIEQAIEKKDFDSVPKLMSDQWLADNTFFGPVNKLRERVEEWYDAGVSTPILVPSSTKGGQIKALEEVLGAFD